MHACSLASVWIFTLVCQTVSVQAVPSFQKLDHNAPRTLSLKESMYLLDRYGYANPGTSSEIGNKDPKNPALIDVHVDNSALTIPPPEYTLAVRRFQRQYSLPVTGQMDEATSRLLTAPRCGNPDEVKDFVEGEVEESQTMSKVFTISGGLKSVGHVLRRIKRYLIGDEKMKWAKKKLTWQIRSYPSRYLSRARTYGVFQHTFNLWSKVIDLDFVEEKDYYKEADIVIQFGAGKHGDSIPFDGEGGVLAHAFYPTPNNVYSFAGDAHFDDDETWNDGPHNEYRNLVSVAAHELGHSMGLGHSTVPTAIMYPYYIGTWDRVKLDEDDIVGMQQIYGAAKPGKFIPPEPVLPDVPPPPPLTPPTTEKRKLVDFCNTSIDVIIKIRNLELYIFKGPLQWRVTWSKMVNTWVSYEFRDGPTSITYYWPALPKYVDYIDAGVEREDAAIYMFRGRRFWLLADNVRRKTDFPLHGLPLTQLGLPETVTKIDTAFQWDVNKKIYLFAGRYYWKLDEKAGQFGQVYGSPDYPRLIEDTWEGVPVPVDAAFTGLNGETIFFSGTQHYVFDNIRMSIRPGYPKPSNLTILGCTSND
ncbi:matrix metalloproteinase-25 [Clonorchis sinensis]|uniref:Matrix metalloproteinase-25 n=1 Tax=Clonorchis sinensis TaxID=79923 RepID=G7YL72_CLOSI|nr:matrix metalloproteinase-25 [Clonorchis sinensis]